MTILNEKKTKEIKQQIHEQRKKLVEISKAMKPEKTGRYGTYVKTGISGFDSLLEKGIPFASALLIAGGPGSGKTIFCLQTMFNTAKTGKKTLYLSFEESEERLKSHLMEFGMDYRELEKKGLMTIMRLNPFQITRSVRALLEKAKGELLIDIDPVLLPVNFQPDLVIMDSLSAIASAFYGREESYRTYLEQLFKLFERMGATSFLIAETEDIPRGVLTRAGVEEFLADGIVIFYNIMKGDKRHRAIEILKLRGASHKKEIVSMDITKKGVIVDPKKTIARLEDAG